MTLQTGTGAALGQAHDEQQVISACIIEMVWQLQIRARRRRRALAGRFAQWNSSLRKWAPVATNLVLFSSVSFLDEFHWTPSALTIFSWPFKWADIFEIVRPFTLYLVTGYLYFATAAVGVLFYWYKPPGWALHRWMQVCCVMYDMLLLSACTAIFKGVQCTEARPGSRHYVPHARVAVEVLIMDDRVACDGGYWHRAYVVTCSLLVIFLVAGAAVVYNAFVKNLLALRVQYLPFANVLVTLGKLVLCVGVVYSPTTNWKGVINFSVSFLMGAFFVVEQPCIGVGRAVNNAHVALFGLCATAALCALICANGHV